MIELAAIVALLLLLAYTVMRAAKHLLIVFAALILANVAPLEAWQPWRDAVFAWLGDYAGPFLAGAGATLVVGVALWRWLKAWTIHSLYREDEENARRKRDSRLAQL